MELEPLNLSPGVFALAFSNRYREMVQIHLYNGYDALNPVGDTSYFGCFASRRLDQCQNRF